MGVTANLRAALLAADTNPGLAANLTRAWHSGEGHSHWSGGPQHSPLTPRFGVGGDLSTLPGTREQQAVKYLGGVELYLETQQRECWRTISFCK